MIPSHQRIIAARGNRGTIPRGPPAVPAIVALFQTWREGTPDELRARGDMQAYRAKDRLSADDPLAHALFERSFAYAVIEMRFRVDEALNQPQDAAGQATMEATR